MPTLTVATYNVHSCQGFDGRVDPERIGRVIAALDADVIALQEVANVRSRRGEQLERIAAAAGYQSVAGPTLLHPQRDSGIALLSRLPLTAQRPIDLSVDGREPRGALRAEFLLGPLRCCAWITHLGLRGWERQRQLELIANELDQVDADLLIVMGDINEWWPRSGRLAALDRRLGKRPTPATFPAPLPLLALDRVWVGAQDGRSLPARLDAVGAPPARVASDHLPLRARISL